MSKSIHLKYLLVADQAVVEAGTNKISIIGMINEIYLKKENEYKTLVPKFVVINELYRKDASKEEANQSFEVVVLAPSRKKVASFERTVSLPKEKKNIGFITNFFSTTFEEEGEYIVQVLLNGEVLTEVEHMLEAKKVD